MHGLNLKNDRPLAAAFALLLLVAIAPVALIAVSGGLKHPSDARLAAVLTFAGVLLTALTSVAGILSRRRSEERLRLEAAMHAGELFNATNGGPPHPAAVASGLLALTDLGRADLAVALLVDLWRAEEPQQLGAAPSLSALDRTHTPPSMQVVSDETAILVLDEALKGDARTQLVAAEVLCRNAKWLDICGSLHWPPTLDGSWNSGFGVRTKVLLVEALIQMAQVKSPTQSSLQWLTVRLYGISVGDPDPYVKGCMGTLLSGLVPALHGTKVESLMFGAREIPISEIEAASRCPQLHKDRVFWELADQYRRELEEWFQVCSTLEVAPGRLAAAIVAA